MEELAESLYALPRNYCLAYRLGGTKFYFAPASHIVGNALRTGPEVAEKRLKAIQAFHRKGHAYKQLFPWPEEMLKEENPYQALREAVKKAEGTYTLLDYEPNEAVSGIELRGDVLTANVSSKSGHGRYATLLKSIHLDHEGRFDLIDVVCGCDDHVWDRSKGGSFQTIVECMHVAAMEQEAYERLRFGDRNKVPIKATERGENRPLFSPFLFAQNWYVDEGRLLSVSRDLAALEWDVLVDRYVKDSSFYDINQKLLDLPIYSTPLVEGVTHGEATYEIIKQRRKQKEKDEARTEKFLFTQLDRQLRQHGYSYDGYCLELGMPAMRYESRLAYVGLVFSGKHPPFYVVRMKNRERPKHLHKDTGPKNPFEQLNYAHGRVDDKTRVVTRTSIHVPNLLRIPESEKPIAVRIPETLKPHYAKLIREHSKHPDWDLRKAGLGRY